MWPTMSPDISMQHASLQLGGHQGPSIYGNKRFLGNGKEILDYKPVFTFDSVKVFIKASCTVHTNQVLASCLLTKRN